MKIGDQVKVIKSGAVGVITEFSKAGDDMINVRFDGYSFFFYPAELEEIKSKNTKCWVEQKGNAVCQAPTRKFKLLAGRFAGKTVDYCEMHAFGMAKEPKLATEIKA